MRKTKLTQRQGNVAVVEICEDDTYTRVIVPSQLVSDTGTVAPDVLEMGIPYGLPWEEMVTPSATPETIANELRRRGMYTAEDLLSHPKAAFSAVQAAYGVDAQALIQAAIKYKEARK